MLSLTQLLGISSTVYMGINNTLWTRKEADITILQKSTNGGESWTEVYNFADNVGAVIELDNGTLLVSTDSNDVFENPPAEWWRSTNGGSSFTKVLTYTNGGVRPWSFSYTGQTVFVSEYGAYPSSKVYRSTDGGATWSTVFDHPRAAANPTKLHLHAIHVDNFVPTRIWLSVGDGIPSKGIWVSIDSGNTWSEFDTNHQPTWITTTETHVFFMEDLEGIVHSAVISQVLSGTHTLLPKYRADSDDGAELANLSFYSGYIAANGYIFAGGIAYGENSLSGNVLDGALLVSMDGGDTWRIVKTYDRQPTVSSGPAYISKEDSNGLVYIKNNNPNIVEILDTNDPLLLTLPQTYFPNRSKLTLNALVSL